MITASTTLKIVGIQELFLHTILTFFSFISAYWELITPIVTTIAALLAAMSASRSARMSEIANKAQFSPFILPSIALYYKEGENGKEKSNFGFYIENRTEYKNAFAKDISIKLNGEYFGELSCLDPGGVYRDFFHQNVPAEKVFGKLLVITYQDILGNKFETKCRFADQIEFKEGNSHEIFFTWNYIQY